MSLAMGPAAMDQTVITSCSKDKLQSGLRVGVGGWGGGGLTGEEGVCVEKKQNRRGK